MTPLAKRLPRELKNNIGKYLGIFLLMCGAIALTSGFLLAAHSISQIIEGMHDEYTIEDGRFTTSFEATDSQLQAARDAAEGVGGVTLYKNYSIDATITLPNNDGTKRTLRTYEHRAQVDLAAYCEGTEPSSNNEVAIDRVFAKNNNLHVGDTVHLEGRAYTVCGIMTQPDSQALFLNNSDFTVNTITYGVAEVSPSGFQALEDAGGAPAYTYSFTFANRDLSIADRTDAEKDMAEALTDTDAHVDDLTDASTNQGIGYAADDVKGDSAMWTTLLYIIIVIMAFVFVVLTNTTIEQESAIIGTLLASGYAPLPDVTGNCGSYSRRAWHRTRSGILHRAHASALLRIVQPTAVPGVLGLGHLPQMRRGARSRTYPYHTHRASAQNGKDPAAVPAPRSRRQVGHEARCAPARTSELRSALPPSYLPEEPWQLCHTLRGNRIRQPAFAIRPGHLAHYDALCRQLGNKPRCRTYLHLEGAART